MKSTGIVRKVDELGRIVLPIELRRTMGIDVKDALPKSTSRATPSCSENMSRPAYSAATQRDIIHFGVRMFAAPARGGGMPRVELVVILILLWVVACCGSCPFSLQEPASPFGVRFGGKSSSLLSWYFSF